MEHNIYLYILVAVSYTHLDVYKRQPLGCAALPEKSAPNQGTYMGTVLAPLPEQCAPPRQNERVATSGP